MSLDLDDDTGAKGGSAEVERPLSESELTGLLQDWQWTEKALAAGELDAYADSFVAILNGAVIDSSRDAAALRERVARTQAVDAERPVILFVDPIDVWPPFDGDNGA